jgi:glycerol kinase
MLREPAMAGRHIIAIDQGTTSSRVVLIDDTGAPVDSAAEEVTQIYPQPGWVEHDPAEIWDGVSELLPRMIERAGGAAQVAAIGITNQRETTVLWDRDTGEPVHNAIVWQDRRTADLCAVLRDEGLADHVQAATGLLIDPYFSATKLAWLLDHVAGARARASHGKLCFGTIDSWLIWKLTGGRSHVSDASNAARTMLLDIHKLQWDAVLLDRLGIPAEILPQVRPSQGAFGECETSGAGAGLPILGVAGDQQAATFGQACFEPGMIKSTYGTGCFMLANSGRDAARSQNRLLTTIAWQRAGETTFALEGSIFMAGAIVQWLRDQLGVVADAVQTAELAAAAEPASGVYLVPAFVGLGAPYWDADARAAISGLTRGAGRAEIVRAGLEAVAFQSRDLIEAMAADMTGSGRQAPERIRVDGGMAGNDWFVQCLADHLAMPVERSRHIETTALGAGYLAGLEAGLFASSEALASIWSSDAVFEPQMAIDQRETLYAGWRSAVSRVLS